MWRSDNPLYALGVVAPHLYVRRHETPFWTLSLTQLLHTAATSKKSLKGLRRELSSISRSSTTVDLAAWAFVPDMRVSKML